MILLSNCGGRTGNQLFQVSHAVSCRRGNEWVISLGFGSTLALLTGSWKKKWLNIDRPVLRTLTETFVFPVLYRAFIRTGIFSSHFEKDGRCLQKLGRVRWVTVMKGHFETCHHQTPNLAGFFRLRASLRSQVRYIVDSRPRGTSPVFLHVRRFEYLAPSRLPDRYYLNAVRIFQRHHPNSFFIVVGDDPAYAERILKDVSPKVVSRQSASEDLALMSLCDGGVLSNSTFAWWGAFFGKRRLGYVAPKYWSGWPRRVWDPPDIRADFMTELVDV
jgi:Glycosyl transferase family 11